MECKGGPVHSIEPQIYLAAVQAKQDGMDAMVIGDGADYVFGGMDKLLSKNWEFDEFMNRYIYINPEQVVKNPYNMAYLFERYRIKNGIDFVSFLDTVATEESYGSYANAFETAEMAYFDPYACMALDGKLDLNRIRSGESKYLIRELFKIKYPEIDIPEKNPMPRPVDYYFDGWCGPCRDEFREDIIIDNYSGNQKWQLWCMERFLNNWI